MDFLLPCFPLLFPLFIYVFYKNSHPSFFSHSSFVYSWIVQTVNIFLTLLLLDQLCFFLNCLNSWYFTLFLFILPIAVFFSFSVLFSPYQLLHYYHTLTSTKTQNQLTFPLSIMSRTLSSSSPPLLSTFIPLVMMYCLMLHLNSPITSSPCCGHSLEIGSNKISFPDPFFLWGYYGPLLQAGGYTQHNDYLS